MLYLRRQHAEWLECCNIEIQQPVSKLSNYGEGSKPREIITSSNGELACRLEIQRRWVQSLPQLLSGGTKFLQEFIFVDW